MKLEFKAITSKTLALGFLGGITVGILAKVWILLFPFVGTTGIELGI